MLERVRRTDADGKSRQSVNLDDAKRRFDDYVDARVNGRRASALRGEEFLALVCADDLLTKKTARHLGLDKTFTYSEAALRARRSVESFDTGRNNGLDTIPDEAAVAGP